MLQDGTILGSYVIDGYVASGGMGVVYRAQHRVLRQTVALKVLQEMYARNPKIRQRFEQEAMLQANLQHPNIVRVTDFLTTDVYVALVMDFVAGPSLDQVLEEEQPGPWAEADWLPMFTRVVSAVAYAHVAGVVHRDIKPGNVLLDRSNGRPGLPRIADFGIAKIVSGSAPAATRAGSRMGTVPYMAPEQFRGDLDVGPAADVFALGMLAWRLAAGALPVNPDDMVAATELYTGRRLVPSFSDVAPNLAADLARVLGSCLSLAPAARPADAGALLRALRKPEVAEPSLPSPTPSITTEHTTASPDDDPKPDAPAQPPAGGAAPSAVVEPRTRRDTNWLWRIVALVGLIAVGLITWDDWSLRSAAPSVALEVPVRPVDRAPPAAATAVSPTPPTAAVAYGSAEQAEARAQVVVTVKQPNAPPARLPTDSTAYVRIEPGAFKMGTPRSEKGRWKGEERHTVTFTRAFYLKRTEVTQAEWRTLMGNSPAANAGCDDCPVERVSWYEAVAFANAMSTQESLTPCYTASCSGTPGTPDHACTSVTFTGLGCTGYRLPTEAEWEYAARAGTTGATYASLDAIAWYVGNSGNATHPVGQKTANAFGLSDVIGNVWEWCHDGYSVYPSGARTDPTGVDVAMSRVFRGGSWGNSAQDARAGNRNLGGPAGRVGFLGFRPARSIP